MKKPNSLGVGSLCDYNFVDFVLMSCSQLWSYEHGSVLGTVINT